MGTFSLFSSKIHYLNTYMSLFFKNLTKTLNIIFSQINNVNANVGDLQKINILRKYLIKSYQGYCHSIGKPVRGQRTWSNAWNSFKCNNILRSFINKVKKIKSFQDKNTLNKVNFQKIKKK